MRMHRSRSVLRIVAASLACACAAPMLRAQQLLWEIDGDASSVRFGARYASVGDVDGDGADDLVITDDLWGNSTLFRAGAFHLYSGATQSLIWSVTGSVTNTYLGERLAAFGDLDGDGIRDFGVWAEQPMRVDVYSTGKQSMLVSIPFPSGPYIGSVADAGDLDLDGVSDIAMSGANSAFVYSGATGANLLQWSVGPWNSSIDGAGDVDGDGVPDIIVGDPMASAGGGTYNGRVLVYSGGNGSRIREIDGVGDGRQFGMTVRGGIDLDQDGVSDFMIANSPGFADHVFLYSGATGTQIGSWATGKSSPADSGLAVAGDLDHDGFFDVLFSLAPDGNVHAISGADQADLFVLPGLSNAVAKIDVDGDGNLDVLAQGFSSSGVRAVFAYSSVTPPVLTSITPKRGDHSGSTPATVTGAHFAPQFSPQVLFGATPAGNVVVVDSATITCTAPANAPGPTDVTVQDARGASTLAGGFTYTPATTWTGSTALGGKLTIDYLCDPHDGIYAIAGAPPVVSIPTPPFDGELSISPFVMLFLVPTGFISSDHFTVNYTIPNNPSLTGATVLLQALIGPSFKQPRDATWTNCAELTIQ
jgi:hypothetical protein